MLKKVLLLSLVILYGCGNPPAPEKKVESPAPVKPKAVASKPAANLWAIKSFPPKEGETEGRKFVKFVTEGSFSDSVKNNNFLYVEVVVNKTNAGIFLHELKKSNAPEAFSEPVQIRMINSSGQELQMTSSRRWNSSGGISIERNNNDYSQFRIFLMQSKGAITVEIKETGTKIYHFSINAKGFNDSFTKI